MKSIHIDALIQCLQSEVPTPPPSPPLPLLPAIFTYRCFSDSLAISLKIVISHTHTHTHNTQHTTQTSVIIILVDTKCFEQGCSEEKSRAARTRNSGKILKSTLCFFFLAAPKKSLAPLEIADPAHIVKCRSTRYFFFLADPRNSCCLV
jgi:hypothetical protein